MAVEKIFPTIDQRKNSDDSQEIERRTVAKLPKNLFSIAMINDTKFSFHARKHDRYIRDKTEYLTLQIARASRFGC